MRNERYRRHDDRESHGGGYWDNNNSICQEQQREIKRTIDDQDKQITALTKDVSDLNASSKLRDEQIRLLREDVKDEKRDRTANDLTQTQERAKLADDVVALRAAFAEFKLSCSKDMDNMSNSICARIDAGLARIENKYDMQIAAVDMKSDKGLQELAKVVEKNGTRNLRYSITILTGIVMSTVVGVIAFALNR